MSSDRVLNREDILERFGETWERESSLIRESKRVERARIRTELIDWLIGGRIDPKDAGLINGRRIVTEIDRICPKE